LLTRSHNTSISSHFSSSGAICNNEVKNWLEEFQFILILLFSKAETFFILTYSQSLCSAKIQICFKPSSKSCNGLLSNLSSQVKIISSSQTKMANHKRNLIQVQDCHKNISFLGCFNLLNHQFISKLESHNFSIFIQKSFKASIIYFVSFESRHQYKIVFHSTKLARIKSLFVIDFEPGKVRVFISLK
jgi:hypothetical protein